MLSELGSNEKALSWVIRGNTGGSTCLPLSEVPQDCCKASQGFLGKGREGNSKFNIHTMAECLLNGEIVTLLKIIHEANTDL